MNPNFLLYCHIADFLAEFLGKNAEIVVHDLAVPEHSIIKIINGEISGRKTGDPATDFVMRTLGGNITAEHYRCDYLGTSKDGKILKCASFYIQDEDNRVIGMLCINLQIDEYLKAREFLDSVFLSNTSLPTLPPMNESENLGFSISELIDNALDSAITLFHCDLSHLTTKDKEQIIEHMNSNGIFLLKGSVNKTALRLGMSEPSVYRYINKCKNN